MRNFFKNLLPRICIIFAVTSLIAMPGFAAKEPGTALDTEKSLVTQELTKFQAAASASSSTILQPIVTETGFISVSIDALGVATNTTGSIQVAKPAGATVRGAYVATADVWGSNGGPLPNSAIKINGNNVNWDVHVKLSGPYGGPNHAWADVTSIVGPAVDAAAPGIVNLNIIETEYLDGSILAVIFDDPNQTQQHGYLAIWCSANDWRYL